MIPARINSNILHYITCTMQVEFYFSDSNLPRDKFLLEQVKNDEEVHSTLRLRPPYICLVASSMRCLHMLCLSVHLSATVGELHGPQGGTIP